MCRKSISTLFYLLFFIGYINAQVKTNCGKVIYNFDFANGIPPNWQNSGDKPLSLWEYRGPNTNPNNNIGSRGGYSDSIPIYSESQNNGFVIFDSDYLDNNGTSSFGIGPSPAPHSGNLITQKLNFSNYNFVNLNLESKARLFYSEAWIKFSTDSGFTFFDSIQVHKNLTASSASKNPELIELNISSQVAQKAKVWVAFHFNGAHPSLSPGYYYWMVDDITFIEPPITDLEITSAKVHFNNHLGSYSAIPKDQITTFWTETNLKNNGRLPSSTKAKLEYQNRLQSTLISHDTLPVPTMFPFTDTTLIKSIALGKKDTGLYELSIQTKQDSIDCDTSNNIIKANYKITKEDGLFASDFQWLTDSISGYIGTKTFIGGEDGFMMLNLFEFEEPYEIQTLWLKIGKPTTKGAQTRVVIFDTLGLANGLGAGGKLTNQTNPHFVGPFYDFDGTEGDSGEVYLPVNQILQAGAYFIGIECFTNGGVDTINVAYENVLNVHQPEASLVYLGDSSINQGLYSNPPGAYLMRLNQSNCDSVIFSISGNVFDGKELGEINNVQIAGGKGPYFTFWTGPNLFYSTALNLQNLTTTGNYELTVYDKNGCIGKQNFYVPTGIVEHNNSKNLLIISPNPSNGLISISSNNQNIMSAGNLEVLDISGRLVYQESNLYLVEKTSLDLSHLPKGEYLIKLSNSENTYTNTLILK